MSGRPQNVFLTGASSGIGAALAHLLLKEGFEVWGTSRSKSRLARFPSLHPIEMRLEEPESVERAWRQAVAEAGRIDIVIQNAGAGLFGAIEDVSLEDSRRIWRVLVEGPLVLLQHAAEHLRPRREGAIIGISSLAAELPMCFCAHYSAGKAAFSALLAGLWMELKPFGVQVVDLRPGDIRTEFNDDLPIVIPENSAYAPWAEAARGVDQKSMRSAPPPELIARAILRLLRRKTTPCIVREGTFHQSVVAPIGSRLLPRSVLLQSIRSHYHLDRVDAQNRESK
jgi:short-subunit dehydrogenase